jgi:hypothetical protein
MTNNAKSGWAALLLSLMLTAPCLAQDAPAAAPRCSTGTVGGKCLNPAVANPAMARSRVLVFNGNQYIPPVLPSQEAALDDPLRQSDKFQPHAGINASGPFALSGFGGALPIWGRWH